MPIYEYKCRSCGQVFEALQSMSAPPLTDCVHCKGPVDKLISASAFHLKGSGWYVTDYKGKKSGTATDTKEAPAPKQAEAASTPAPPPAPETKTATAS